MLFNQNLTSLIKSQKGLSPVAIIIIGFLILAIISGMFLLTRRTSLVSNAANDTRIEIFGKNVKDNTTSSRLVGLKIYYGGPTRPTNYRIANDLSQLNTAREYTYDEIPLAKGIFWALAPAPQFDTSSNRQIFVQFKVNGSWQAIPSSTSINLTQPLNPYSLAISCEAAQPQTDGSYKANLTWKNPASSDQNQSLVGMVFDSSGNQIYSINPTPLSAGLTSMNLPLLSGKYSVFIAVSNTIQNQDPTQAQIQGISETTFACAYTEEKTEPQVLDGSCLNSTDQNSCQFSWISDLNINQLTAQTNFPNGGNYLAASALATGKNSASFNLDPNGKNNSLKPSHLYNIEVRALTVATDPEQASFATDYFAKINSFFTSPFTVAVSDKLQCQNAILSGELEINGRENFTQNYIIDITDNLSNFTKNNGIWINKEVHSATSTDFTGFSQNPAIGSFPKPNKTYFIRAFDGTVHSAVSSFQTDSSCQ